MELPGWSCAASYFFITSHTAEYPMGGRFRCTRSCLFPCQTSNIVEGIATWASARNTGIGQIVSSRLAWYLASLSAYSFPAIPAWDLTLRAMGEDLLSELVK
eukprot:1162085-Pelagomonas_calceolata.AAC.5